MGVDRVVARITILSLYDEYCLGARQLIANLRRAGHEADLVCLKAYGKQLIDKEQEVSPDWQIQVMPDGTRQVLCYPFEITAAERRHLADLLARLRPQVVGLSTFSPQIQRNIEVTQFVRETLPGVPILWGGPHATLDPEGSCAHADYVMVGEADTALVDLCDALDRGGDLAAVPSVACGTGAAHRINPLAPLVRDLDSLPFAYHGEEWVWYIENDECSHVPPRGSDLHRTHKIMTSRGCPYSCTYCILSYQKEVLPDSTKLRFRSIEHVMRELEEVLQRRGPYFLEIEDDIFTMRRDRMEEFFAQYGRRIGMPFWCYTHPRYALDHHLELLKKNNAQFVVMGIESGSDRVAGEVFNRRTNNDLVIAAAERIKKWGLRPFYDIISNNPFEDENDRREMLNLIRRLPKPFQLQLVELNFFPNIAIDRMRRERGLPRKVDLHEYRFWNALYHLASAVDLSDADVERFLGDPRLREDPSMLEAFAAQAKALADAKADSDLHRANAERELERQAARARALEAELADKTHRRGFRQFLWLSDRLRRLRGRFAGNGHAPANGRHAPANGGAAAPAQPPHPTQDDVLVNPPLPGGF